MPAENHLLFRNCSNGVDSWETVIGVLADRTDADLRALALGEAETNPEVEYYVKSFPVLEIGDLLPERHPWN